MHKADIINAKDQYAKYCAELAQSYHQRFLNDVDVVFVSLLLTLNTVNINS